MAAKQRSKSCCQLPRSPSASPSSGSRFYLRYRGSFECPLWVKSRYLQCAGRCPLYPPKADIRHAEPDVDCSIWNKFHLRAPSVCARFLWTPFQDFSDLSGRFAAYLVATSFKLRQSRMFKLCQFFPFVFAIISTIPRTQAGGYPSVGCRTSRCGSPFSFPQSDDLSEHCVINHAPISKRNRRTSGSREVGRRDGSH